MTLPPPSPRYGTTGEVLAATLGAADLAAAAANPIHNGGFNIWQRGTSFAAVASRAYTADRWWYFKDTSSAVHSVLRSTDVPAVAALMPLTNYSAHLDCTTADAALGTFDVVSFNHNIEGYNWAPFAQKQFTVGFWVKATKTGTYCLVVSNTDGPSDRSYVAEYAVNVTDTWEYKTVTISASPSGGTWDYTNGTGIYLAFILMCGSTAQTTAGTWQTGNFLGTANQVNACDSVANNFRLWGVTMGLGSTVAPFWPRSFGEELALCQRYYQKTFPYATAPAQNSGVTIGGLYYVVQVTGTAGPSWMTWDFPVAMRATPTVTTYNPSAANDKVRNLSGAADSSSPIPTQSSDRGVRLYNPQVAGDTLSQQLLVHATATADL